MAEEVIRVRDAFYILSTSARIDDRTRALKHGDTFALFDRFGDIDELGAGELGIYHQDTRFLSRLVLWMGEQRPLLLSSTVKDDNACLAVDFMNPDIRRDGEILIPRGTVHIFRARVLWQGTCYERLRIHNYAGAVVDIPLSLEFDADFADIFEVRGTPRERRGRRLATEVEGNAVVMAYEGLDGRRRRTRITFDPPPTELHESRALFQVRLEPRGEVTYQVAISCVVDDMKNGIGLGLGLGLGRGLDGSAGGSPENASVSQRPRAEAGGVVSLSSGSGGSPHDSLSGPGPSPSPSPMPFSTVDRSPPTFMRFEDAMHAAAGVLAAARAEDAEVFTSNEQFNDWLKRSIVDLHMMRTDTVHGPYPYAGIPWYNTAFGRDGIITALECLWVNPAVARGVLTYLAATQAEEENPEQDAQPGKILHETRACEMAALGEVPFGRYYGTIDATPLFVVLAGAYYQRTGDLEFIRGLWPHVVRALRWIDEYGDADGDGFVEYARCTPRGLLHQGWKDSQDSIFHEDGRLAEPPIALCEIQAYVYAAKLAAASLAGVLGDAEYAERLTTQARELQERFENAFWCDDLSTYALALDGQKRQCRVRTSNAGHCLFGGIASADRARRVAAVLTAEPSFSGWGVRTVATTEARYNPMSYHNGSVWPHDNAIIAAGFARYGLRAEATRILTGMFDASIFFDLHRLPELFCGFPRRPGESPTQYPVSCAPQAWAAAAVFLLFQACLGLEVRGAERTIVFSNPMLPGFLDEVEIRNLRVGEAGIDLALTRRANDVAINVLRRRGDLNLVVVK